MNRDQFEPALRQALAARDERRRQRLFDADWAREADDAFVAEIVAAAGFAAPPAPERPRRRTAAAKAMAGGWPEGA